MYLTVALGSGNVVTDLNIGILSTIVIGPLTAQSIKNEPWLSKLVMPPQIELKYFLNSLKKLFKIRIS